MKKSYRSFLFAALSAAAFCAHSCKQEQTIDYEQAPGVYFTSIDMKFTFVENQEMLAEGKGLVNVPVKITGFAADHRRTFTAVRYEPDGIYREGEVPATPDMFSLGEGWVDAGMYEGVLPVTINYKPAMDENEYTVYLRRVYSDDFPIGDLNDDVLRITFGNIVTKPENWESNLKRYFGEYSDSWYQQILAWTGLSSLPYKYTMGAHQPGITEEEAARWPMLLAEVKVWAFLVSEKLADYNNDHPGNELTHQDGPMKDQPVRMGTF